MFSRTLETNAINGLLPMALISPVTVLVAPCTTETSSVTATTPMMMPSAVRKERILLSQMARTAILQACGKLHVCRAPLKQVAVGNAHAAPRPLCHLCIVGDQHDGVPCALSRSSICITSPPLLESRLRSARRPGSATGA